MTTEGPAERLILRIAELCECTGHLPDGNARQCLAMAAELCELLNAKRKPPENDFRAAVAYGYALMLSQAIKAHDAQTARLELVGIYDQLLSGSPTAQLSPADDSRS